MTAATRTATTDNTTLRNGVIYTWAGLDGDDVGSPVLVADFPDKTVQIGTSGGTTDGGATTVLQGSNDPLAGATPASAEWFTLTDPQGNAISATTASILEQVTENPLWIRPHQTGGSSGDLDVVLVCVKVR